MTSTRRSLAALLALGVAVGAGAARADEPAAFGERHQLVISALSVLGYSHAETRGYLTGVVYFNGAKTNDLSFTSAPNVGVDFLVARRLSLGAGLSVFRTTITYDTSPAAVTYSNETKRWGFTVAPRVGVVAPFGAVALWPQLALYYSRTSQNLLGPSRLSDYGVSFQAPVLVVVGAHVFVSFTLSVSVSLGGSDPSGSYTDARVSAYAAQAGIGTFF
jgi:hypothetical protein